jgi:hypothetical protein
MLAKSIARSAALVYIALWHVTAHLRHVSASSFVLPHLNSASVFLTASTFCGFKRGRTGRHGRALGSQHILKQGAFELMAVAKLDDPGSPLRELCPIVLAWFLNTRLPSAIFDSKEEIAILAIGMLRAVTNLKAIIVLHGLGI